MYLSPVFQSFTPPDMRTAVFTSIGAASACWENTSSAGVFQRDLARAIGQDLVVWIDAHYTPRSTSEPIT